MQNRSLVPLLALLLLGCSAEIAPPEPVRPVRAITVERVDSQQGLVQTGEVAPRRETDLAFLIDGRLAQRPLEVGARVTKGQILARLDSALIQNELRASRAEAESAKAALELARSSQGRIEQLATTRSATPQQADEAAANVRAAQARHDMALAVSHNVGTKLGYSALAAPESGVVTAIGGNRGQVLGAGQMVVRLASEEREAIFTVAERMVGQLRVGQLVKVRLIADPTTETSGTIRELGPTADRGTHTHKVWVRLDEPPAAMSYGAAVSGAFELPNENLLALPASALTSEGDAPAVYVVDPAHLRLERRKVSLARFNEQQIWVKEGLEVGDRVVIAGVSKLRPEQPVALAPESP